MRVELWILFSYTARRIGINWFGRGDLSLVNLTSSFDRGDRN